MSELVLDASTCAAINLAEQIDPIGTAGTYDRIVLVEWPLPWPDDVSSIDALAVVPDRRTRMLIAVPDAAGAVSGSTRLTVWSCTDPAGYAGYELMFDCPCPPAEHLEAALRDTPAEIAGDHRCSFAPAGPQLLVCTHGRRDRCCGSLGTRLAAALADRMPQVEVRRTSHLGGHRFAPTAVVLPDGRCWGHLDAALAVGIAERSIEPSNVGANLRGLMSIDEWAQVVDRSLLERFGWGWADRRAVYTTTVASDRSRAAVEVEWSAPRPGRALGTVTAIGVERLVVCGTGEPSGKTAVVLALESLEVDD